MPTDKPRVTFAIPKEKLLELEEYQHENKIKNQTQAILSLIEKGLAEVEPKIKKSPSIPDEAKKVAEDYLTLDYWGQRTVRAVIDSEIARCKEEFRITVDAAPPEEPKMIPLYRTPAAAGYAAPAFGTDFDYIPVEGDVPQGAEFAVRIQGDSMAPLIPDESVVYVNRDPLRSGDVGIFCVDGDIFCKQYHKDPYGIVYLFSLNRQRADADVVLTPASGRSLACFGRVILRHVPPLPGME